MGVLDQMTKGITERKAAAAGSTLTPVGLEASSTKPTMASLTLPNDLPGRFMAGEDLGLAAVSLREHAATLLGVADSIDQLVADTSRRSTPPGVDTAAAEQKAAEKAADKRVAEADEESMTARMVRLQAEAQAAVFTGADAPAKAKAKTSPKPVVSDGWTCPEHGDSSIEVLTSRLRPQGYRACTEAGCGEFEPKG